MTQTDRLLPHLGETVKNTEFCAAVDLSRPVKPRATDDVTPEEFLAELISENLRKDAIRVAARALHPQHAVEWARACVGDALGEKPAKRDADLLAHADEWLADPANEELRRGAMETAERAEYDGPSAWVLAAAGWSGGSIAPITAPPVPPPPGLCQRAASGAVVIAVGLDHKRADERAQRYLDSVLDYAQLDPPTEPVAAPEPEPEPEQAPRIRSLVRGPTPEPAPETTATPQAEPDAPAPPKPAPGSLLRKRNDRR